MDLPELTVRKVGEWKNGNKVDYRERRLSLQVTPPYGLVLTPTKTHMYIHVSSEVPVRLAATSGTARYLIPMAVQEPAAAQDPLQSTEQWKKPRKQGKVKIYLLQESEGMITDREVEKRESDMEINLTVLPNPLRAGLERIPYGRAYRALAARKEHYQRVANIVGMDATGATKDAVRQADNIFSDLWKGLFYVDLAGRGQALEFRTAKIGETERAMGLESVRGEVDGHLQRFFPLLDYGIWKGYCENELIPTEAWIFTLGEQGSALQAAMRRAERNTNTTKDRAGRSFPRPTGLHPTQEAPMDEEGNFPDEEQGTPLHEQIAERVLRDMEREERRRGRR